MQRRIITLMAHDMTGLEIRSHLEMTNNTLKAHTYMARRRNRAQTNLGLVARLMAENEGRIPPKPAPRSEWVRR